MMDLHRHFSCHYLLRGNISHVLVFVARQMLLVRARVVKSVDTADLKSADYKTVVPVRFRPRAPIENHLNPALLQIQAWLVLHVEMRTVLVPPRHI